MVLAAARDVVSEAGANALSMRAVARRLDVAPNALYSHVQSKTQLIDDLLDDVLAAVVSPRPEATDPVAAIFEMMTSTYEVLTAHGDLVPLYLIRQGARGPNATHLGEVLETLLARAGVGAADLVEARRALIIHAVGSAAFATHAPEDRQPITPPTLLANFTTSLRWLLDGISGG